jgi:hypothetical protein
MLASKFLEWLHNYEYIAVWLEGIALVLILCLDWRERVDRRKDQKIQDKLTRDQLAETAKSANAATEAALAAKKSADISAALHRPFVGLSGVALKSGWGTRYWDIAFGIKNYGTLPAVGVGFSVRVFTDDIERLQHTDPASFQIFPSSEFEAIVRFDLGEPDMQAIQAERKQIRSYVKIPYRAEDGRGFEFTAEVVYKNSRFTTHSSTTRTLGS